MIFNQFKFKELKQNLKMQKKDLQINKKKYIEIVKKRYSLQYKESKKEVDLISGQMKEYTTIAKAFQIKDQLIKLKHIQLKVLPYKKKQKQLKISFQIILLKL